MSINIPRSEPVKSAEKFRQLIDGVGARVIKELARTENKTGPEADDVSYRCRTINSNILTILTNEHKMPGIIVTLQPMDTSEFKKDGAQPWTFHSIGIVEIGPGKYLAFDQTNTQEWRKSGPKFLTAGSLEEVSKSVSERFGYDWNLPLVPSNRPENSVTAKIKKSKELIDSRTKVSVNDIVYKPPYIEDLKIQKPLGLKIMPPMLRYGYA